jgi:hypothetical protein
MRLVRAGWWGGGGTEKKDDIREVLAKGGAERCMRATHLEIHLRNTCSLDSAAQDILVSRQVVRLRDTVDRVEVIHCIVGELELAAAAATDGFFNTRVCVQVN